MCSYTPKNSAVKEMAGRNPNAWQRVNGKGRGRGGKGKGQAPWEAQGEGMELDRTDNEARGLVNIVPSTQTRSGTDLSGLFRFGTDGLPCRIAPPGPNEPPALNAAFVTCQAHEDIVENIVDTKFTQYFGEPPAAPTEEGKTAPTLWDNLASRLATEQHEQLKKLLAGQRPSEGKELSAALISIVTTMKNLNAENRTVTAEAKKHLAQMRSLIGRQTVDPSHASTMPGFGYYFPNDDVEGNPSPSTAAMLLRIDATVGAREVEQRRLRQIAESDLDEAKNEIKKLVKRLDSTAKSETELADSKKEQARLKAEAEELKGQHAALQEAAANAAPPDLIEQTNLKFELELQKLRQENASAKAQIEQAAKAFGDAKEAEMTASAEARMVRHPAKARISSAYSCEKAVTVFVSSENNRKAALL